MRNERQHELDRAVIAVLARMGNLLLEEKLLLDGVARAVAPRALLSEGEESLRYQESQRRILGVRTETGVAWKLTDEGRAWAAEHRV